MNPLLLVLVVLVLGVYLAQSFKRTPPSVKWAGKFQRPAGPMVRSSILPPVQCMVGDEGTGARLPPIIPPSNSYEEDRNRGHDGDNYMVLSALWLTSNRTMHDHPAHTVTHHPFQHWLSRRDLQQWLYAFAAKILQFALLTLTLLGRQLRVVASVAPTVAGRLAQYLNPPLAMLISLAILKPTRRIPYLQAALWGSLALGSLCLLYDLYSNQDMWRPLQPTDDSYALITGAQVGIGRELAGHLYNRGYNLVLVDNDPYALEDLRRALLQGGRGSGGASDLAGSNWNRTVQAWSARLPHRISSVNNLVGRGMAVARPVIRVCARSVGYGAKWLSSQLLPSAAVTPVNTTTTASCPTATHAPHQTPAKMKSASLFGQYSWLWSKAQIQPPFNGDNRLIVTSPGAPQSSKSERPVQLGVNSDSSVEQGVIHCVVTDFTDPETPLAVVQDLQRHGVAEKMEVVVHAAQRASAALVVDEPLRSMQDTLQANAYFPVALTKLLLPGMLARLRGTTSAEGSEPRGKGGARILFLSSLSPTTPSPGASVAGAAAAFVASFAQSLRRELLHDGVLVTVANLVLPETPPAKALSPTAAELATPLELPQRCADGTVTLSSEQEPDSTLSLESTAQPLDSRAATTTIEERSATAAPPTQRLRAFVPFRGMRTRAAAREIYCSLDSGSDAITPGVLGRLYRHGVAAALPAPVLGTLHQAMWSPAPSWMGQSEWRLLPSTLPLADKMRLRAIRQGALDSAARATSELQRLGGAAVVTLQQLQRDLRERFAEGLE